MGKAALELLGTSVHSSSWSSETPLWANKEKGHSPVIFRSFSLVQNMLRASLFTEAASPLYFALSMSVLWTVSTRKPQRKQMLCRLFVTATSSAGTTVASHPCNRRNRTVKGKRNICTAHLFNLVTLLLNETLKIRLPSFVKFWAFRTQAQLHCWPTEPWLWGLLSYLFQTQSGVTEKKNQHVWNTRMWCPGPVRTRNWNPVNWKWCNTSGVTRPPNMSSAQSLVSPG